MANCFKQKHSEHILAMYLDHVDGERDGKHLYWQIKVLLYDKCSSKS